MRGPSEEGGHPVHPRMTLSMWLGVGILLTLMCAGMYGAIPVAVTGKGEEKVIFIPPRTGIRDIALRLKEGGVIRSGWAFVLASLLTGSGGYLQPGEYELHTEMSLAEVLWKIRTGKTLLRQVTIPEGYTVQQVGQLLASQGLVGEARFIALATDPAVAARHGLGARSLEGYLFPDTYRLTKGMTEEEVIERMVARFRRSFGPAEEKRAAALGLSLHEVVTLASLIEKETRTEKERPLVSAVFHNRLRRRMPLQSDPTVIYGLPDFSGRLTREQLRTDTPYNTYTRPGLPPGPIASPGEESLRAALYPALSTYLYFVSRNDGTHFFSSTLEEHGRAVRRYQLGKK